MHQEETLAALIKLSIDMTRINSTLTNLNSIMDKRLEESNRQFNMIRSEITEIYRHISGDSKL